ncbi:MAG: hypothetical protein ACJA1A_003121 [Saprospiraceae bacterium]
MKLKINETFNKELPADPILENYPRQVIESCYSNVTPRTPSNPQIIHVSSEMLEALGITEQDKLSLEFLNIFSGKKVIQGTSPYAMCYGGHQFGHWAGQLGDGRAINLTELVVENKRWALQLKGSGATPYSRTADGLAVLRSSIREHLCSEAMHHLGVPTTRSLSLMLTGDDVLRDVMYDGHPDYEKGAVVCRVAPSFIRFGNFQIFTSRKDEKNLKLLTDYTIRHFFSHIEEGTKSGYIQFFEEVLNRTLEMVIHWQRVGFVHGVMNTDNLSILGLTIDYGPYGWLEGYDDNWTPNTTDSQHHRYSYAKQPGVALWNLAQLGSALVPIIGEAQPLQEILDEYKGKYRSRYLSMMRNKLGLQTEKEEDQVIIDELENLLQVTETDMTIFFRNLANLKQDNTITDVMTTIADAFYKPEEITDVFKKLWNDWLTKYTMRLQSENTIDEIRKKSMNAVNPKYVLRNYMAQLAIDKADKGDYSLIKSFYLMLKSPYSEQPMYQQWFSKRPEWARNKVGCSMLSCSS